MTSLCVCALKGSPWTEKQDSAVQLEEAASQTHINLQEKRLSYGYTQGISGQGSSLQICNNWLCVRALKKQLTFQRIWEATDCQNRAQFLSNEKADQAVAVKIQPRSLFLSTYRE